MAEGYKEFVAATVLDAADLTDFCSSQAVMRFANAAGRDAALTVSVVLEGMYVYLKDTNVLQVNTDATITGWKQIFPVITAGITDGQVTNAKMAVSSVSSANIIDATIVGADIAAGTITGSNIQDGSIGTADLAAGTYSISITGNANTATSATDSDTLGGFFESYVGLVDTIALRGSTFADINAGQFVTNNTSLRQFFNDGTHTQIGDDTARVVNATTVHSQSVSSARTVLITSAGTLGTSVSSRRYKIDIETLEADTEKILQLDPVTFFYLPEMYEEDQTRTREVGLIAEQAADLGLDELVFRNDDGLPEAIAYEKLAVYLLKVCQTQQSQIDALTARLDTIGV